jgi:hypothetical protein
MKVFSTTPMPRAAMLMQKIGANLEDPNNYRSLIEERVETRPEDAPAR